MHSLKNLVHIVKRESLPWYKAWAIRGAAILLALVICSLVTVMVTGLNPLALYRTMFYGAFGTERKTWLFRSYGRYAVRQETAEDALEAYAAVSEVDGGALLAYLPYGML